MARFSVRPVKEAILDYRPNPSEGVFRPVVPQFFKRQDPADKLSGDPEGILLGDCPGEVSEDPRSTTPFKASQEVTSPQAFMLLHGVVHSYAALLGRSKSVGAGREKTDSPNFRSSLQKKPPWEGRPRRRDGL